MKSIENFTIELLAFAQSSIQTIDLKRNEYLIKEGQIEHHLYLVEDGALRVLFLTEHEEQTIRFGYKNSIINSLSSFLKSTPSEFYIQAIRQTKVVAIPKKMFYEFVNLNLENLQVYTQTLEDLVTQQIEREIDILTNSPLERLKRIEARSPQLFQEIPAKYIAAYLRMSPETLSRIRK
jgi:CRP-like cAMP-binding protein